METTNFQMAVIPQSFLQNLTEKLERVKNILTKNNEDEVNNQWVESAETQIKFADLLNSIDWRGTESDLLYKFQPNIEKGGQGVNKEENSTSDFSFKNVDVNGFLCSAPIRVNAQTKKIFRINFIVYDNSPDDKGALMDKYLEKCFSKPYISTNDPSSAHRSTKEWTTNDYAINASHLIINNKHSYIISVEPLRFYPVDPTKAIIENNPIEIALPYIESFKVDNNDNIIIKIKGKEESKHIKTKKGNTSVGDIIFFDAGGFCFREKEFDVLYFIHIEWRLYCKISY